MHPFLTKGNCTLGPTFHHNNLMLQLARNSRQLPDTEVFASLEMHLRLASVQYFICSPLHGALPRCAHQHLPRAHFHLQPHLGGASLHGQPPLYADALAQDLADGGLLPPQAWRDMVAIQAKRAGQAWQGSCRV